MDQKRIDEYKESMKESEMYPEELGQIGFRLKRRIYNKKRKTFLTGLSSIAAIFVLFVFIVNSKTAMADSIFHIPVLGDLAKYVCFDKGLQNAIKNEYAKEVNLTDVNNGYTLSIPYVIPDSKRLEVFFEIPNNAVRSENDLIRIKIDKIVNTVTGKKLDNYGSGSINYPASELKKNASLFNISIRSNDISIPQDIKIYVTMIRESYLHEMQVGQVSEQFEGSQNTQTEVLGAFVFDLHLKDIPEPKVTNIDKDIEVKGQTIHINSVVEYPTGTEISINIPDNNDYIINGINFKSIDTNGDEWGNPGGLTSSGPDSKGTIIYYIEGDYFSSAKLDKIQITGIRLIKKSEAEITIDLEKMTMTPEISETRIKSISKTGDNANITLQTIATSCFGFFRNDYVDTEGNKYRFNSEGTSQEGEKVQNYYTVVWPKDNKVILTRSMSPMLNLENPVEIKFMR